MKLIKLVSLILPALIQGAVLVRRGDFDDVDYDLTILHTNDIHSHYDENNKYGTDCTAAQITNKQCYGGVARLKTVIDQLRAKHPKNLLVDAGDQFQGTLFYTYYKGNITWEVMNMLKYDMMTLGNHEFDNGPENVARVIKNFNFPVVSSNIDVSKDPFLNGLVHPYQLFPQHKVAVIGYITYTAPSISNLGKNIQVLDPIVAVQNTIDQIKKLGYERIIAVSHNGYMEDMELASKTRGLSLIVGGHSHTYLAPKEVSNSTGAPTSGGLYPTAVKNLDGKDAFVVQAYCWGRYLGHIDIKFDNTGYLSVIDGAPIEMNEVIVKDTTTVDQVKKWRQPFDDYGKVVLGEASGDFIQSNCQFEECFLGDFVSDIMLAKRPKSDLAFINAGGIRAAIGKGPVTVGDVITVSPFGNAITDIELTGKQIQVMLEGIISKVNQINNRPVTSFIQIAGMRFVYDDNAAVGSRIVSVEVFDKSTNQFKKLDLTKTYTATTLDFLANGGDNLITPIPNFSVLDTLDTIIMDFIKANTPVTPKLDGRIKKGTQPTEIPSQSVISTSVTNTVSQTDISQSITSVTSTGVSSQSTSGITPTNTDSQNHSYPTSTSIKLSKCKTKSKVAYHTSN